METTAAHTIRCGHCHGRHSVVDAIRACGAGSEIWACTWLVSHGWHEDTEIIRECGADSWEMPGDRGYECAAGHSHVNAEHRQAEGWDYASDAKEAAVMRKYGVDAVGPDGGSI